MTPGSSSSIAGMNPVAISALEIVLTICQKIFWKKKFPFSAHNVYIHFFRVALALSVYPLKVAREFKNRHARV